MIQTTTTKDIYHGDGTTRRFEVTFDYNTKNNVKQIDLYTCTYTTVEGQTKYNNDVTQITNNYDFEVVDGVTYSVYPSDAAVSDGATPISTGTAIIIMRNTPNEQLSTGQYTSEKVEKQLDRITMVAQELQEQVSRSVKLPIYAESIPDIDFGLVNEEIQEVLPIADDLNTVANNISDINTVFENIESINTTASNIPAITAAPIYASNAQKWAEGSDSDVSPLGGTHSSKNWASEAAASATACEIALSKITLPLLSFRWYDCLLNDQRWLRADTFSWQDGEVYSDAYNHLVNDIGYVRYMIPNDDIQEKFYRSPSDDTTMFAWTNQYSTLYTESEFPENGDNFYYHNQVYGAVLSTGAEAGSSVVTPTTETIGSYTITYYLADDVHKIVLADQETTVANIYNESGVAWYYILDTTNQRFKLPRENPAREELIQVIRAKGNGMTLGLTNGTNNYGLSDQNFTAYGTNYGQPAGSTQGSGQIPSGKTTGITTDSTKSGVISDMTDSTSVYKGKQYLYFYVGQFTQSATEQTAGLNSELFNGKVDLNLNNMNPSATAKETIVGWGMPDWASAISITLPYTAPKNGYVLRNVTSGSYIHLNIDNTELQSFAGATSNNNSVIIPVLNGNTVSNSGSNGTWYIYFIPCVGG